MIAFLSVNHSANPNNNTDTMLVNISFPPSQEGYNVSFMLTPRRTARPPPYGTPSGFASRQEDNTTQSPVVTVDLQEINATEMPAMTPMQQVTSAQEVLGVIASDDPFVDNELDRCLIMESLLGQRRVPSHLLPASGVVNGNDQYNVPAALLSEFPPSNDHRIGFAQKRWYAVFRGRYIGVFYNFW
jgi:hypothetical protein